MGLTKNNKNNNKYLPMLNNLSIVSAFVAIVVALIIPSFVFFESSVTKLNDNEKVEKKFEWRHGVEWNSDPVCHTPIDPIIGAVPPQYNKRETRIINVGLPKCGSSSLNHIFSHSGYDSSHWTCDVGVGRNYCGQCIFDQIQEQRQQYEENSKAKIEYDLFNKCGNFHVWTEIDFLYKKCIFPQIQYLEELYADAPNATWLMPMRNVSHWVNSVTHWHDARKLAEKCDFLPYLNVTIGDAKSDDKMMELYCTHIDHIRYFVKNHPTLSYIEFRIEDPYVGSYLKELFPSITESNWGNYNHNSKLDKTKV